MFEAVVTRRTDIGYHSKDYVHETWGVWVAHFAVTRDFDLINNDQHALNNKPYERISVG